MNKGKAIFISVSMLLLTTSVWIYFKDRAARQINDSDVIHVKARLSGYELYRYKKDELKARVSGRKAKLVEPSELICEEKVLAVRFKNGIREQVEADAARLIFLGESLFNQKNATLDRAELSGGVEFVTGTTRFLTEWLRYTEKSSEAYSDKPVRIDSEGQFVAAEGGMTYNIKDETVRLRGGVLGSLRSDKVGAKIGSEGKK